jgi:regulatory protein
VPTEDGRAEGSAGPVRVADFDALDDPEEVGPAVRVASFDLDDGPDDEPDAGPSADVGRAGIGTAPVGAVDLDGVESAEEPRTRVVSFDDPPDDGGSDATVRRARFDGALPADRRDPGSAARRRGDGTGRPGRGGRPRREREGRSGPDRPGGLGFGAVGFGAVGSAAVGSGDTGRDTGPDTALGSAPREESGRGRRGSRGGRGAGRADAGPPPDDETRAKEICLRLLTDRARTVQELRDALVRKEIPEDVADRVLERFDEVGLVDDEAFAGQWVRSRHRHRGLGRRAIAQELRRKGVAKEIADEALTEIDAESEEARARELVDRKIRTVKVGTREERASASRRLVGMLARKGYGAGVAYTVVREAIAARGAEEDELGEEPPED